MDLNQVLIMPYVTEKTEALKAQSKAGQVIVFKIRKDANKELVKQAIHKIYNVNVLKVNIINTASKLRRFRNSHTRNRYFLHQAQAFPSADEAHSFQFPG